MKKVLLLVCAQVFLGSLFAQSTSGIDQKEQEGIVWMRQEEKLARDVYDSLLRKWGSHPFNHIRQSEQRHMDRMENLIAAFQLTDPVKERGDLPGKFANPLFDKLYQELVTAGSGSEAAAFEVGARIEELDIKDLNERMAQAKQKSILETYEDLKWASGNHLRAFVRNLKGAGKSYQPVFLSANEFNEIIKAQ